MKLTSDWWTSIFGGGEKVGSSTSLAEHGLAVNTSAEIVHSVINGQDPKWRLMVSTSADVVRNAINSQDPKWRSMVSKNAEIGMVRAAKSEAKICFHTLVDKCPRESWCEILHQN